MAQLAKKAKLNHESLYRMLSERGNPEFRSLEILLHALRFWLAIVANRCAAANFELSDESCAYTAKTYRSNCSSNGFAMAAQPIDETSR